jgi:hypothetical protein
MSLIILPEEQKCSPKEQIAIPLQSSASLHCKSTRVSSYIKRRDASAEQKRNPAYLPPNSRCMQEPIEGAIGYWRFSRPLAC